LVNVESVFIGEDDTKEFSLSSVLSGLIEQSRIVQQRRRYNASSNLSANWIEDFCTITLRGNRGVGHTKSIIDVIIEKRLNSIFYAPTQSMVRSAKQFLFNKLQENGFTYSQPNPDCIEACNLDESFFVHFRKIDQEILPIVESRNVDAIFIDPYSELHYDHIKLAEVKKHSYGYAYANDDFFFVGVG
jgi:hypothetical protein